MIEIKGPWNEGHAFDLHTLNSVCTGRNEFGHATFDTTRSEMGQHLYELKYGQHLPVLEKIAGLLIANQLFCQMIGRIDVILPVPPSNKYRKIQPVLTVAKTVAARFRKEIRSDILLSTNKYQLKNLQLSDKYDAIKSAIEIDTSLARDKKILIFDDVYDSGSTLAAMTDSLKALGYSQIYVFTLTKTRNSD